MVQCPSKLAQPEWEAHALPWPGWHEGLSTAVPPEEPTLGVWDPTPALYNEVLLTLPIGWSQDCPRFPVVEAHPMLSVEATWEATTGTPAPPIQEAAAESSPSPIWVLTETHRSLDFCPTSCDEVVSPFPASQLKQKVKIGFSLIT